MGGGDAGRPSPGLWDRAKLIFASTWYGKLHFFPLLPPPDGAAEDSAAGFDINEAATGGAAIAAQAVACTADLQTAAVLLVVDDPAPSPTKATTD